MGSDAGAGVSSRSGWHWAEITNKTSSFRVRGERSSAAMTAPPSRPEAKGMTSLKIAGKWDAMTAPKGEEIKVGNLSLLTGTRVRETARAEGGGLLRIAGRARLGSFC
jgi:hypothetical protein